MRPGARARETPTRGPAVFRCAHEPAVCPARGGAGGISRRRPAARTPDVRDTRRRAPSGGRDSVETRHWLGRYAFRERPSPSTAIGLEAAGRATPDGVHPIHFRAAPLAQHCVVGLTVV